MSRLLAAFLFLLAGCGRPAPAAGPIHLLDDGGTDVVLAAPAARIVSLVPAATELLFALGAGSALVGRTRWCDYPAAAAQVPSVGDGMAPNVEAVAGRNPDLVVMYRSAGNDAAVSRLRGIGVPVVELALDRQADFDRAAGLLARAVGRPEAGDSLVRRVQLDLADATRPDTGRRMSVLVLAWSNPPIAIGAGSFLSEIISRAGAANVFADVDRPSFTVSLEAVVARNPDVILVVGDEDPPVADRPEWQTVPAVRERRFVRVDGSMFNRPSPRIGEAVRTLARALGGR